MRALALDTASTQTVLALADLDEISGEATLLASVSYTHLRMWLTTAMP